MRGKFLTLLNNISKWMDNQGDFKNKTFEHLAKEAKYVVPSKYKGNIRKYNQNEQKLGPQLR